MEPRKKLSVNIVLPVYNEGVELEQSVTTLHAFLDKHMSEYKWRISIADNASTDDTLAKATMLSKKYGEVSVVHLPLKGRGRAVKKVWAGGNEDFLLYMDIDLSTDLKHVPSIVHALERGFDVAIGSRNARGARVYGRSMLRTITSKVYIALIKMFFFVHFTDAQCGFKGVSRKVVRELLPHVVDNEWFFDTELLILAEKTGLRIYEEPVNWIDNPGSTVRVLKTATGDLSGLWRLFKTRPWRNIRYGNN
jgi:glycosyltransferase involved in cell wall biosynthesis